MIVLYCAYTVGSSVTYKIARSRATLLSNYPVRIQIILRDREIIRMKSVHSRFREHMARKIRKHALPGDIACCHGPGIKALNCCETAQCLTGQPILSGQIWRSVNRIRVLLHSDTSTKTHTVTIVNLITKTCPLYTTSFQRL